MAPLWRLFIACAFIFTPVGAVKIAIASVNPSQFLSFDAEMGVSITERTYQYSVKCPASNTPLDSMAIADENITAGMVYFNPSDPDIDMGPSKYPLLSNNLPQHGDALLKLTFPNPLTELKDAPTRHPQWDFSGPDKAGWTLYILFRPRSQALTGPVVVSNNGAEVKQPEPVLENGGRVCHLSSFAAIENCAHQFRRVAVWLEVPKPSAAVPAMIFQEITSKPRQYCIGDEDNSDERWETNSHGAYKCSSSLVTLVSQTMTANNESAELEVRVKFANLRVMPFGEQANFPMPPFFDKCHKDSWLTAYRRYESAVLIHGRTGLASLYAHLLHLLLSALAITAAVLLIRAHLRQKRLREEYERETQSMVTCEEFDDVEMDDVDVLVAVGGGKRGGKGHWMKPPMLGANAGIKYGSGQSSEKVA